MMEGVVIRAVAPRRPLVVTKPYRSQADLNSLIPQNFGVETRRFSYTAGDAAAFYGSSWSISRGPGIAQPSVYGLHGPRLTYQVNSVRFNPIGELWGIGIALPLAGVDIITVHSPVSGTSLGASSSAGGVHWKDALPDTGQSTLDARATARSATNGISASLDYNGSRKRATWRLMAGGESHTDYRAGSGTIAPNSAWSGGYVKAGSGFQRKRWRQYNFIHATAYRFGLPDTNMKDRGRHRHPQAPSMNVADWLAGTNNTITFNEKRKLEINAGAHHRLLHFAPGRDSGSVLISSLTVSENAQYDHKLSSDWRLWVNHEGYLQYSNSLRPLSVADRFETLGLMGLAGIVYDNTKWAISGSASGTFQKHRSDKTGGGGALLSQSSSRFLPGGFLYVRRYFRDDWFVQSSISTGARLPGQYEIFSSGRNPVLNRYEASQPVGNLQPERIWTGYLDWIHHTDLGARFRLKYMLSGFYNQMGGLLLLDSTGVVGNLPAYTYITTNAALHGYEAAAVITTKRHLPRPLYEISLRQSFSRMGGRRVNGMPLPLIQAPVWNSVLQCALRKTKWYDGGYVQLEAVHAFAQRRPAAQETATPAYTLLNFFGEIRLYPERRKSYTLLSIAVRNLLNAKYADHLSLLKSQGFLNPGRDVMVSVRWHGVW